MAHSTGRPALFASAFSQSRNAMVLLEDGRRVVDADAAFLLLVGARSRPHLVAKAVGGSLVRV